eukprot:scaffold205694_cov13-Prasinocladus_malaysianus.AAC.1
MPSAICTTETTHYYANAVLRKIINGRVGGIGNPMAAFDRYSSPNSSSSPRRDTKTRGFQNATSRFMRDALPVFTFNSTYSQTIYIYTTSARSTSSFVAESEARYSCTRP